MVPYLLSLYKCALYKHLDENLKLPVKLIMTISKIPNAPNFDNSALIKDFYQYLAVFATTN